MNLLLRLIRIIIHALCRPALGFWEESVTSFRVLPNDIDFNMHMTNSRYFSIMDLGRVDLLIRTGLGKLLFANRRQAIIGATNIRFRRALKPNQSYKLHTRVAGIDEKWFYIEQRFESKEGLVAYALVKGIFITRHGSIPMSQILQEMNLSSRLPELPEILKTWSEMDESIKQRFGPKLGKTKKPHPEKN